jgi:hypothetical protein
MTTIQFDTQAPALTLQEITGPTLRLDPPAAHADAQSNNVAFACTIFVILALLSGLLLVSLSRQQAHYSGYEDQDTGDTISIFETIKQLFENHDQTQYTPSAPDPEPAPAPAPVAVADPFDTPLLASLKGKYCFNFLPSGNDAQAKSVFNRIFWSKLSPELTQMIGERTDVCTPFEAKTEDVIEADGCQKSNCSVNDVRFFINTDGKAALDYTVNGECKSDHEDGFTQTELLCPPNR